MTLTVSEASRAYREKRKAKLQRLAAYEAALREIAKPANGPIPMGFDDWKDIAVERRQIAAAALNGADDGQGEVG